MTVAFEFSDVWMTYQSGFSVLRGVSFTLRSGEIVILAGENGAGKTTIFDIGCGNARVTRGTVRVRGSRINGRSPQAIAGLGVRRMYQSPAAFRSLTVLDNVLLACRPALYAKFPSFPARAMRWRLWRHVRERSDPLFSVCGFLNRETVQADSLSFGERRIVDFLGVVSGATAESILLLDEPFAGIHRSVAAVMWSMIAALGTAGAAVLIIEHLGEFSEGAGMRVLKLAEGVVQ